MSGFSALRTFLTSLASSKLPLLLVALLVFSNTVVAAPINLVSIQKTHLNLGSHLQYWIAPKADANLKEALALTDDAWTDVNKDSPNFGFTSDTYWFRVAVKNELSYSTEYFLEFAYPAVDLIDLNVFYSDDTQTHFLTGDNKRFESRPIDHHNFVFPLHLGAGQTANVFFKIQTEGALQVPLSLIERNQFNAEDQRNLMAIGAYFGILMIMGLYNLFIFSATRDVSYIWYVLSLASWAMMQLALHGVGFQMIWRDHEAINRFAIPIFISFNIIFTGIFSLTFLKLKSIYKVIYDILRVLILGGIICIGIALFGPYNLAVRLSSVIGIVGSCAFIVVGWTLWIKGHEHARYYALAWTSVLLMTILFGFNKFGWVPRTVFTEYAMQVGGVLEAILLSFALADRINSEKREKLEAKEHALDLEKRARSEQERALRLEISAKEAQMHHREKLIEAENKAKSQFITIMSHELRTPLNGILGLTSLLKGNQIDTEQRDHYLDVITLSGHSLLNILQSILDYSRLDSSNVESEVRDENIKTICDEVVRLFIPIVERKDLNIAVHFHPQTPTWVSTDGARLRQVLLNLIGNAEKFTDSGQINLTVSADDKWLRFEIQDTGIGIATEKLDGLFQPFNQVDSSATRRHGGAGMGLSLCKRLIDVLGGEIGVRSALNKGSTFWFTLPYREAAQPISLNLHAVQDQVENAQIEWEAKRALIVEDNAVNRMVVMGMLKKIGLKFETAENGEQAVDLITTTQTPFDLILMDCDMPVMDGYTATEHIRAWEMRNELPGIPIIALTAQTAPEHVNRALRSGMTAHLGKPISLEKLESCMQRFLNLAQQQHQSIR